MTIHEQHELMSIGEFIAELRYSRTTFYRLLRAKGQRPPGKYLTPAMQNFYRAVLGFPPKWPEILPPPTPRIFSRKMSRGAVWDKLALCGAGWDKSALRVSKRGGTFVSSQWREQRVRGPIGDRSFPTFFTKIYYAT